MAVVTDVLRTVVEFSGVTKYVAEASTLSAAFQALAAGEIAAGEAALLLKTALTALAGPIGWILTAIGALVAAMGAFSIGAAKAFGAVERDLVGLQLMLRNMGRTSELDDLTRSMRELSERTGKGMGPMSGLTSMLLGLNFTREEIQRTLPVLADWSAATGIDMQQAADILGAALRGERDAIQRYGVDIDLAWDRTKRLDEMLKQLGKYKGGVEVGAGTLPGALERLSNAWQRLLANVGDFIAPHVIAWVNRLTSALNWLNRVLEKVTPLARALGWARQSDLDAERVGKMAEGNPKKDTENLEQIAKNTAELGPIIRQAFGGAGSIGQRAGNTIALRAALKASPA